VDATGACALDVSTAVLRVIGVSTFDRVVPAAVVVDIAVRKSRVAKATPNRDSLESLGYSTSNSNRGVDCSTFSGIVSSEGSVAGSGLAQSVRVNVRRSVRIISFTK